MTGHGTGDKARKQKTEHSDKSQSTRTGQREDERGQEIWYKVTERRDRVQSIGQGTVGSGHGTEHKNR